MKAVIYTRVSSEEQVQGTSLESQERLCREYCVRQGWAVDRVFSDRGESAKTADRPQFQAMVRYCCSERHDVHAVVIWKLDRFSRSNLDTATFCAALATKGVTVQSATEHLGEGSSGKVMRGILGIIAEFDNDVRSDRSKTSMRDLANGGYWVHRAPVGLKVARDSAGRPVCEPSEHADLVRSVFEKIADGKLGTKKALSVFAAAGVKLQMNDLHRILRQPIYAGVIVSKLTAGREVPAKFSAIVPRPTWDRVQAVLAGRSVTAKPRERTREDLPLKGLIQCGHCGTLLTGSFSKGRNGRHGYYHCWRCGAVRVTKAEMEKLYADFLDTVTLKTSGTMRLFREIILDVWHKRQDAARAQHQAALANVAAMEHQQQVLLDKLLSGVVADDVYKQRNDALRAELAIARSVANDQQCDGLDVEAALNMAEHLLSSARSIHERLNAADKGRFQAALFPQGLTYTKAAGLRTAGSTNVFGLIPTAHAVGESMAPLTGATWNQIAEFARAVLSLGRIAA